MKPLADAAGGGQLVELEALRDRLAQEIDECESARDVAALGRLFADVVCRIAAVSGGGGDTMEDVTLDELARRRSDRGADPAGGARSAGR